MKVAASAFAEHSEEKNSLIVLAATSRLHRVSGQFGSASSPGIVHRKWESSGGSVIAFVPICR